MNRSMKLLPVVVLGILGACANAAFFELDFWGDTRGDRQRAMSGGLAFDTLALDSLYAQFSFFPQAGDRYVNYFSAEGGLLGFDVDIEGVGTLSSPQANHTIGVVPGPDPAGWWTSFGFDFGSGEGLSLGEFAVYPFSPTQQEWMASPDPLTGFLNVLSQNPTPS